MRIHMSEAPFNSTVVRVDEAPLHAEQERVDDRANQPEDEGSHDDLRWIEVRPCLHDQVAEPGIRPDELRAHDDEESQAEAEAQSAASTPSASAAPAAMANPWATRTSEVMRFLLRLPSRIAATVTAATSPGVGTSTGLVISSARLP